MADCVRGVNLIDAWLADLEYLVAHGDILNLVTTISDPDLAYADARVIMLVDELLLRKNRQSVWTVANTIFPIAYQRGQPDRNKFYERYQANLPRLLKLKGNTHGTYFGRLIENPIADNGRNEEINQIEGIIRKLEGQLRLRGPKRFVYQAQVFNPERDGTMLSSFPCLSYVSIQLYRGRLHLTAVYRNQYYFERALGNFIGLARLQRFIANEVGLELGSLTVHACHAEIDVLGRRETEELVRACRGITDDVIAA